MAYRVFPSRIPETAEDRLRSFGRREDRALERRDRKAVRIRKIEIVALVAGCVMLGILASGVI